MTKLVGFESVLLAAALHTTQVRDRSKQIAESAAEYWRSIAPVDPSAPLHPVEDLGFDVAGGYKASIGVEERHSGPGYRVGTRHALALPLEFGNKITEREACMEKTRQWLKSQGLKTK